MSDGTLFKPDKDFTKDVDKQIPEAQEIAKTNLTGAIDKLLALEKQARQVRYSRPISLRLLGFWLRFCPLCKDAGYCPLLNEQVVALSEKTWPAQTGDDEMVQVAMGFLDETPNMDAKMSLIETLRNVTEGKIFVEVERARVTRILSEIKKSQGDIVAAADILCELQVETFGSMARKEKTEFILEQVALCIARGDWTQAKILSRKINTRYFARKPKKTPEEIEKQKKEEEERERQRKPDEPPPEKEGDVSELKLRYYEQQIILANHENEYLEVCKYYRQVLDTESVEESPNYLRATLQRIIYYVVLSPYDNEQSDLLHRIKADSRNSLVSVEAQLIKLFTTDELMRWPMVAEQFGPHLCSTDVFDAQPCQSMDDKPYRRWQDFRKRVIEHNIRVIAKYYTRIETDRLTELLDLNQAETEKYISDLVTSKTIYARIDRPARIVSFAKPRDADDVLNEWSGNMQSLLGLLERIDHLITKEEMMARILPSKSGRAKAH
ncbi:conserved hypothetical protein [Uncinocarpus reesii 1704]|uniref:PCI domain-containing protein n=1 Tax=Uncinocarpus reesii (strain UAMH 1704) TaxID=336963 RepID=C4JE84_UNCRE|nr:uncharacterized protein UREG_00508 [Uncinocarpus reesii 1704]EEP75662.1 conserved hypothetical protein [Uncinocarpus reesii 1704]